MVGANDGDNALGVDESGPTNTASAFTNYDLPANPAALPANPTTTTTTTAAATAPSPVTRIVSELIPGNKQVGAQATASSPNINIPENSPVAPPQTLETDLVINNNNNLNFTYPDLVPVHDAEAIRDKWLGTFLASPDQVSKAIHPFTVQYISRVLKTYPQRMLQEGGIPPFIHPMQVLVEQNGGTIPLALANCYCLVRMWMNRVPGSENMVAATVQAEMKRIADEVRIRQPSYSYPMNTSRHPKTAY